MCRFLISSMVLGLLDQLQIFLQFHLIELLRSGPTRAVALDISKVFSRVWHAVLLHKFKYYGISGQIFALISSFLSNGRFRMVLTASTPIRGMLLSRLGWDP